MAGVIVVPHDEFDEALHDVGTGGMPAVVIDRLETGRGNISESMIGTADGWRESTSQNLGTAMWHSLVMPQPPHRSSTGWTEFACDHLAFERFSPDCEFETISAELSVEGGRTVGSRQASLPHTRRPTATVAAIDLVAFGLLQALLQVGLRVPDDISLVGYDDLPLGRQLSVPLTSIRRPHYDMGLTAAKLLMSAVSGEPLPQRHVVFEPELIAGSSTAVPRPQIRTV